VQQKALTKSLRIGTFLFAGILALAQTLPTIKQDATNASCSNIVALAGSKVNLNCSNLTPGQRKALDGIPAILNKILSDQLDPEAVMKKLDEILHAVNPNLQVRAFFCNGTWRDMGPSANAGLSINMGGDDSVFRQMVDLNNTGKYADLLSLCMVQKQSTPDWLTPKLFCGMAYSALGDPAKAKADLAAFDARTGPAYSEGACKQMSDFLRAKLP
jgi:hypothetical protein